MVLEGTITANTDLAHIDAVVSLGSSACDIDLIEPVPFTYNSVYASGESPSVSGWFIEPLPFEDVFTCVLCGEDVNVMMEI